MYKVVKYEHQAPSLERGNEREKFLPLVVTGLDYQKEYGVMKILIEDIWQMTLKDGETFISATTNISYADLLGYLARLEAPVLKKQTERKRVKRVIRIIPPHSEPFETTGILASTTPPTAAASFTLQIDDISLAPVGSHLEFRYELTENNF